ncbi:Rib/alpha-like domain-containing protein [Gardnerella swidsinskii]|uniref:Rib/alpha-like domain-containing protein n=1 Tax=Gardnerella swidsinskii TaxID=2792979 RepID=UPI00157270BD|nr:Rib/alpha-like domain-containing protein [Gardnerella swidsinskii]MDK8691370.1 Rib/alpha-like domain-containing protein [Gardnerella swidsinskii]NSX39095.1 peptidase [Gardnerella vaginalis]
MANNTRKKHAHEQVESSFKNVDSSSAYATMRKVSLSTLATVLTAATCLGGQPILASSNILLPPTTAAFAQEVRNADPTPWLHTPNILEFQRYRFANSNGTIGQIGSDGLGDYSNVTKKSDMYAHLEENNGAKYLVFDVFFNNDGKDMTGASKQQQYVWQIPFAVADLNNGYYNGDTLSDLSFDFYKRNGTSPQTTNAVLSRDFSLFTKENSQSKNLNDPLKDDQHLGNSLYKITLGIRGGNSNKQDLSDTFHNNAGDGVISNATTLRGVYSGKSYGIGLRTTNVDYAVHMHCKVKLRQGVTLDDIQDAYTWANTSTYGRTTNSAYTFISGRERWTEQNLKRTKSDKIPPKLYLNGKEIDDSNNSITVYQGDIPTITFGTSDDSGKVNSFSVKGLPNGNGDVTENSNGMEATEAKHHNHVVNRVKFEYKNGNTPANTDYTVTVSATDASGNKVEKKVTVHLKNLNQKYKAPTTTPITVDWGHKATNEELKKHVSNIEGGGQLDFNTFPETKLPDIAFNGKDTATTSTSAKVIYSDNSYHIVTIPVIVRKPLALQHKSELKDHEVKVNVGDTLTKTENKVDAKEYLGITDKKVKDNIKSAEWVNGEPSTDVAGKRTYTAKVTFNDGSTAEEKVTFTVRPQKPKIETDLTGVAGVKGKEVVVNAGPGTAGSTVTLKDNGKNAIGTGKVGADGKVTITVKDGIPAGNVTAVTSTNPADPTKEQSVQSPVSDPKNATKDDKAPTLTGPDSVTVKVGEDLKIQLTAKDDVKIESIDTATATMAFARNDFSKMMAVAARAKTDYTKNSDKEKVFTYSFSGFKPEEVGTYTLTFSATDAAGHKTEKTVTVKVEKKEDIKSKNIAVDLGHKLTEKDAEKAIANGRKLKKAGATFKWSTETGGTPDTSTVGKEKTGKVIVTIPTNDPKNPRVETVDVKVTVKDHKEPEVTIQQKGNDGNYNNVPITVDSSQKVVTKTATITTYRGDKNDIKITATDNSGNVTTLTLTPKTPGETEKAPTGTGTTTDPKTLTLDGTTPLNTKPGEYTRTLKAVDPSGNLNEVTVKFIVKPQSDKYGDVKGRPVTYNMGSGTKHPDPKSGINADDLKKLPSDATYSWAKEPDWNKPGEQKDAKVRITFKDGSTKDVTTTVTVKDDIAPVINTPSTNKAKRADTDKTPEYYQFKVHNGKPFSIDINAYDNSGKIKSATIATFPGHDGKITIDNQNGNSAEKPATIHIKGTAQRDANITNSSDNKWSRELVVTDEAGNESKLKVQISVYTDAEEHNAAPNATPKNPDQNAITNAITITKKDDPKKTPIDKKDLTFTVGNIPQDDGVHTVPVTITYPDHSTTIVNVPVLIHKDAKDYDPKGQTVEVPWNTKPEELTKKIKSFGSGNGLKWNGNSPKQDPTVEIVNTKDVPSTDKPGERQVQVKVTYKDGSSDVATVTVKVLKPQSETYTPEGQTINIDYNKTPNTTIENKITGIGNGNGIKLKQGDKELTSLPEGASIAIDDKAKTVPDGTQPGTFDIPVTITYKDGSKDHATVKVTVGKPQSETHTPKVDGGITKKYGESGPSDSDIITKVTVPNQPDGTRITVDKGQTPIDTKTPGTVNVKVTVKYPDGSEDHVEVPVTVGNPDNETYKPGAEAINKKRNEKAPDADEIKKAVKTSTVKDKTAPKETKVELVDPKTPLPTTDKTGTTNVPVKVTYPDGSSTVVQVPVVVTDTDATANTPAVDPVEEPYGTGKEKTKEAVKKAVTVPDFKPKKDGDKPTVAITSDDKDIPDGTKPGTYHVKVKVTYPDNTTDEVTVDVTIKNKQSDTFEPKVTPVVKPFGKQVTSDDVTGNVTVPNWSKDSKEQPKIELNEPNTKLPDGKTPGNSTVKVKVTYPDGTTDIVDVPVTISDKQSELYPPKADNLEKDNGQKPSDDEIIGKVSVPTWPTNETNKPTYSIAEGDKSKIPTGDKAGKFEVPVTVTYPDGSTTVINVPVTIKAPTPKPQVVTVPKGVEPKPEDSIANKDKFPNGTKFEWDNNGKPDTSKEGNSVKGKVKITIPGSDTPQEVEVTVNVVDPSASEVNVPQGKDLPEAKDVIKDSHDTSKFHNGTTFEWKPEDKPDTNNPGAKNGKIIVTLPGQSPVEVPVTVNVLPKPEANVVNVKVGDNLPDASKGIANKDKFPEGTTFEWKKDAAPKTDKPGTTNGTVLVHIPGVKDPAEVIVTVNVNPAPIAKETTVPQNSNPDPKNSIDNNNKLPKGTTFEWKKDAAPKTDKPGTTNGTVIVKIPGQDPQEVPVTITVTASPEGNDVTVLQKTDGKDNTPQPKDVIKNNGDLPENAKTSWKKKPDTSKTGNQPGIVTVTVPGEPDVDIPVNVLVVPNPAGKTVSVHVGDSPSAENSIANKDELPNGTKFAWATNGTPDTKTAGNNKNGTVVVTIPGIANPVNVPVIVNVVEQNKPFINGGKAENTPDKSDKTTITGKTQPGNTVTVKDNDGNTVGTGDANKDGNFTIEIDKKDPGTTLKLVPSKGGVDGDATTVTVTAKPQKPTITVPTDNQKNDGNVTVTPPTDDTTVVKIEINAKPNSINGPEQPVRTIITKKDNDGKWKIDGDAPEGVIVNPDTGVVTIPTKNLEDGSTITAVSKNKTDKPSDPATAVTGFKTPQISEQTLKDNPDDSTKQIITGKTLPGATVTVTDKDRKQIGTGTADAHGDFTITIDKQKPGAIVTLTPTNGKGDGAKTGDSVNITVSGNITKPKIDTPAEGGASVTPDLTDTRVNKVVVTYTPEGSETTATITVVAEGDKHEWKIDGDAPEGVTVNPQTGVVTIPANKIKRGSTITAQSEDSSDKTGKSKSEVVTAKVGEKEQPAPEPEPEPTPTPAGEPTILTPQDGVEQGSATVTPPADADTLEITYTPEGDTTTPVTITVKKDKNGNWTIDGNTPTGVTVDPKTGKVTIPATQIKDGSTITAQAKKNGQPSNTANGKVGNNPTKKPEPTPAPTPAPTPEHESGSHDSDEHTGNSENNRNKSNNTQLQAPKSPARHSSGQVAQSKLTNTGSAIAAAGAVAALAAAIGAALAVIIRRKKRD